MGQHAVGTLVDHFEGTDHADGVSPFATGIDETHSIQGERRSIIQLKNTPVAPRREGGGGLLVRVVADGQVDRHDVVVVQREQCASVGIAQYVVRRSGHQRKVVVGPVSKCTKRHEGWHRTRLAGRRCQSK